ncbi:hypothetical protein ACFL6P_09600 [Candidatus Latescibacterota bacterium]
MMKLSTIFTVSVFVLISVTVQAQDSVPDKMSIQGSFGTVTMDGAQWQRFSFRPDIPIGNFGVGLDVELFIDEQGRISKEGWDFTTKSKTWDSILRKIYYVRYGKPLDQVYMRAGSLDDVTLGYGLIMDGYRNSLNYPAEKKIGLDFGLRNIGTFGLGVEGMVNSFGDLQNKGIVAGARISARPFKPYDINILSKMTFGITFVRDVNQYAGLKDSDDDGYPDHQDGFSDDPNLWLDTDDDGITDYTDSGGSRTFVDKDADGDGLTDPWYTDELGINAIDSDVETEDIINIRKNRNGLSEFGMDIGFPLLEGPVNLDLYGQFAKIQTGDKDLEGGWGTGAPGLRLITGGFKGQIEYRHSSGRFRPEYFDNLYDHERVVTVGDSLITKEMKLADDILDGFYGKAGYNFFDMFYAQAGYQYMTGDNEYRDVTGVAKLMDGLLESIPKITVLEAYFYNRFVDPDEYGLFEFTPNTLYGTRIGFSLTPGMSVVWNTRYTFTPNADRTGLDKQRFVSIETVITMK